MSHHPLEGLTQWPDFTMFPIRTGPDGGRRPAVSGFLEWAPGRKEGLAGEHGLVCGPGFFVLDVDHKNGTKEGLAGLAALEAKYGALPETFTVRTQSGGLHFYFLGDCRQIQGKYGEHKDIDTRASRKGYVMSPATDGYEVENDSPMVAAPRWIIDWINGYSDAPSASDGRPAMGVHKTTDDLAQTVGRKTDLAAVFWRGVAKGILPKGLPDSGWNDYLTKATNWLAKQPPDWAEVSGETVAALMGPSLSHMHQRRLEQGADLDHLGSDAVASMYDRASAKIRTARQAEDIVRQSIARAKEAAETGDGPPAIVQHKTAFYVRSGDTYRGPFIQSQLWSAVRDIAPPGVEVMKPTKNGLARMKWEDLMELYGRGGSMEKVIYSLTATEASIDPATATLTVPSAPRPHIDPVFHPQVDHWLDLLGGDVLKDWIRVAMELEQANTALWLSGRAASGKSLLVRGLCALWGDHAPTSLERALAQFNAGLATCPIVDGQEKIPENFRGVPRLDEIKELITQTSREVEQKYTPAYTLHGAIRLIMSSNNLDALRQKDGIDPEDIEAFKRRVTHIHVATSAAKDYLQMVGDIQENWIDSGALAAHFMYLIQNREAPERGHALRLTSVTTPALEMALTVGDRLTADCCRALYDWLTKASKARAPMPNPTAGQWMGADRTIRITATGMQSLLGDDTDRRALNSIGTTLRRMSGREKPLSTRLNDGSGGVRGMWPVPLDLLASWAEQTDWAPREEVEAMGDALDAIEALTEAAAQGSVQSLSPGAPS